MKTVALVFERFELCEYSDTTLLGIITSDLVWPCTRELTGGEVVLSGFFSSIRAWESTAEAQRWDEKAGLLRDALSSR